MNLKKFIQNEYMFSILTKFISIGIGLLQSILVARFLGAELKGTNAYISSIASIGSILITFGMHQAYPYFRKKMGKDAIYEDYISIVSILYIGFLVFGVLLAATVTAEIPIKTVFILIPLLGYSKIVDYVTLIEYPNIRNKWWTIISVIDVLYVFLLWMFVERSITWGLSILLFADVIKCAVYSIILKIRIRVHKGLLGVLKELLRYGFFPMLALLMTTLNYRIDVLMLKQYSYISDAMIGVYSLGLTLADKVVLIPDTLKGVLTSRLAKGAPDEEVAKVSRIGLWSSVLLFALIAIFGRFFISFLYGDEYNGAYSIIMITAFGLLAVVYFKFIAQYNIINKKQILNVVLLSIAIASDVVLNMMFIPIWGIQGAAVATSISNVLCGVVFIIYFCTRTGVPISKMIIPQVEDFSMLRSLIRKK